MTETCDQRSFDFLVLGSGIAGLFYALRVAEHGQVGLVTKKRGADSATNWAQGGIAAVMGPDDALEDHVEDTLTAGAGLCRRDVVERVVERGPAMIDALLKYGVEFDRERNTPGAPFELGREGGHTRRRILHHRDLTGHEIESALLARVFAHPRIDVFEDHCAIDLLTAHKAGRTEANRALGAYVLDARTGQVLRFVAPPVDGMAIAYRAGATLANMEFFQFHPTCLYHSQAKSFLISEAVRGEGGVLRGSDGEAFMDRYHAMADLAPRDIVARAIDTELKRSGEDSVFLDISHREADYLRDRFPNISGRCLEFGIDITREAIPVVPAAHYCCGGVRTNADGETDLTNLFAAGEVASTGLHGANRLASNSLLEALVFAEAAADAAIARRGTQAEVGEVPAWEEGEATESHEAVVITQNWDEIRRFMWNYVSIVRSDKRLARAKRRVSLLQQEIDDYYWNFHITPDLIELRNLATTAKLVIAAAQSRKESRGLHYNLDHPERDDERFARDTLLQRGEEPRRSPT